MTDSRWPFHRTAVLEHLCRALSTTEGAEWNSTCGGWYAYDVRPDVLTGQRPLTTPNIELGRE